LERCESKPYVLAEETRMRYEPDAIGRSTRRIYVDERLAASSAECPFTGVDGASFRESVGSESFVDQPESGVVRLAATTRESAR